MVPPARTCQGCGSVASIGRFCSHCGALLAELPADDGAGAPAAGQTQHHASLNGIRGRRASSGAELVLISSGAWPVGEGPDGPRREGDVRAQRHDLAVELLRVARSDQPLEDAELPGDVAASFLRRYDGRRSTQEAYARDLADWLVWLDRAGVHAFSASLATIERYARQALLDGRRPAPATVARRLACLSHFYRRAAYAGLITINPVEAAQRPKVPERVGTLGVSKDRARELIRAARRAGPRETLLVLLLLELGLRVSEAVGADIDDISDQGRHRVLAVRGKGQTTKATLVPLNLALIDAISAVTQGRSEGPLLATSSGRRLTRQHAGKLIKRLGEQTGIPTLHPHELRHAFVTLSLDEGESLRDVQDAARHADPRTTRRYDRNRNSLDRHPTHRLAATLEP